jgi:sec-independent protein translocase protein TatA
MTDLHQSLALAGLGTTEIIVIAALVLLLFGARKLPELAHSMGASIQSFKKGMKDGSDAQLPEAKKDEPKAH